MTSSPRLAVGHHKLGIPPCRCALYASDCIQPRLSALFGRVSTSKEPRISFYHLHCLSQAKGQTEFTSYTSVSTSLSGPPHYLHPSLKAVAFASDPYRLLINHTPQSHKTFLYHLQLLHDTNESSSHRQHHAYSLAFLQHKGRSRSRRVARCDSRFPRSYCPDDSRL